MWASAGARARVYFSLAHKLKKKIKSEKSKQWKKKKREERLHNINTHLYSFIEYIISSVCFVHLKNNKMKRNARMNSWLKRLQTAIYLWPSTLRIYSAYLIGNVCKTEIDHTVIVIPYTYYMYYIFLQKKMFFFHIIICVKSKNRTKIYFNQTIKKRVFSRFVEYLWFLCHLTFPLLPLRIPINNKKKTTTTINWYALNTLIHSNIRLWTYSAY